MPIELAGISLSKIHAVSTLESADLVSHRIPGLEGNVVQDLGRYSVRLRIEGICYGETALDDLGALREAYKNREPVEFLAELVGNDYFSEVILESFNVWQRAEEPGQFSFALIIAEYVPPPEPEAGGFGAGLGLPEVDASILDDALDFMDVIEIPDLFSVPGFGDPTEPLNNILGEAEGVMGEFNPIAGRLGELFADEGASRANFDLEVSLPSIFAEINANVDDSAILGLIENQIQELLGVNVELEQIVEELPQGIDALKDWFENLSLPDISQLGEISTALSSLQEIIPADASGVLGPLTEAIESFFEELSLDVANKLTTLVDAFRCLFELGDLLTEFGLAGGESAEETASGAASRAISARNLGPDSDNPFIQGLNGIQSLLGLLPDPLNVQNLLEWLLIQLKRIPRKAIPLQTIPVYDELTEKLETLLSWLNMDGAQLQASLIGSIDQLAFHIEQRFLDACFHSLSRQMNNANDLVDTPSLDSLCLQYRNGLEQLAAVVNGTGDLSGSTALIADMAAAASQLQARLRTITDEVLSSRRGLINQRLNNLEAKAESAMMQLIALTCPPSEIEVLNLLSRPFNDLLDEIGADSIADRAGALVGEITGLLNNLNLSAISSVFENEVQDSINQVDGLKDRLTEATADFSLLMREVESAINDIGIIEIKEAMIGVVRDFEATIENGVNSIFGPVRDLVITTLDFIVEAVENFDPAALIQPVTDLINALIAVFENPQLKDFVNQMRDAIDGINGTLGGFSFKVVTDVVVDAIGVAKSALEIAGSIPLPESLVQDLAKAVEDFLPAPEALRNAANSIIDTFNGIIDQGPEQLLLEIKDKPTELVALAMSYSPDQYLSASFTRGYLDFVASVESVKPSDAAEPVTAAIDGLKAKIQAQLDPQQLTSTLDGPFNTVIDTLSSFDPNEIIGPLNALIQDGIHSLTDNIPIDATDAIFDGIEKFAGQVNEALDVLRCLRDRLTDLQARFNGLDEAENQVQQLGGQIVARLDQLDDFSDFAAAFSRLEQAVDATRSAPILQILEPALEALITNLNNLDPKAKLVDLISAHRSINIATLEGLPDSEEKNNLLNLLRNFDPLRESIAGPLDALDDWKTELSAAQPEIANAFNDWDNRFHGPNSPLNAFRVGSLTLEGLQELLADTIRQRLTESLAPLFRVVNHFQDILDAVLGELVSLVGQLEAIADDFDSIVAGLQSLRGAFENLIGALNSIDISFIATEIQSLFDTVLALLEEFRPSAIAAELKSSIDSLLALLDLNRLLAIDQMDAGHQALVNKLIESDPNELLIKPLQTAFDNILGTLNRFDFSEPIEIFIGHIDNLQIELETEINRVADAYEDMFDTIPSEVLAEANVSVSVSIG